MEIETGFMCENNSYQYQYPSVLFNNNNLVKPFNKNDFLIETSSPKINQLHDDFHNLDHHQHHQFHVDDGSRPNPSFSSQTQLPEPYSKTGFYSPFVQNSGEYLNFPCSKNLVPNSINGSDWNNFVPLTSQEMIIKPRFVVLDHEVSSCITAENGYYKRVVVMSKNTKKRTYKSQKMKPNQVKGQWTGDEDRLLIQLVDQHGLRKWSHIAQMLPGRIGKQCRERWHNHLRPDIKKEAWSEEEDKVLIEAHVEIGNKWAEIAKRLPGRTENSIKNHWNATKRRQHSKRKCRSKCPRPSLLQDYIKTLNLPESSSSRTRRHQSKETHNNNNNKNNNNNNDTNTNSKNNNNVINYDQANMVCPIYEDHYGFDEDEDSDFGFGENMMFQEGASTIDSLFDDMEKLEEDQLIMDLHVEDNNTVEAMVLFESDDQVKPKKEMDLMEMISQVGNKI